MDPELILHILLILHLYCVICERNSVSEPRMHLPGSDLLARASIRNSQTTARFPRSARRFWDRKMFEQLFEQIMAPCLRAGPE